MEYYQGRYGLKILDRRDEGKICILIKITKLHRSSRVLGPGSPEEIAKLDIVALENEGCEMGQDIYLL
jgi:hypothetical protein